MSTDNTVIGLLRPLFIILKFSGAFPVDETWKFSRVKLWESVLLNTVWIAFGFSLIPSVIMRTNFSMELLVHSSQYMGIIMMVIVLPLISIQEKTERLYYLTIRLNLLIKFHSGSFHINFNRKYFYLRTSVFIIILTFVVTCQWRSRGTFKILVFTILYYLPTLRYYLMLEQFILFTDLISDCFYFSCNLIKRFNMATPSKNDTIDLRSLLIFECDLYKHARFLNDIFAVQNTLIILHAIFSCCQTWFFVPKYMIEYHSAPSTNNILMLIEYFCWPLLFVFVLYVVILSASRVIEKVI